MQLPFVSFPLAVDAEKFWISHQANSQCWKEKLNFWGDFNFMRKFQSFNKKIQEKWEIPGKLKFQVKVLLENSKENRNSWKI